MGKIVSLSVKIIAVIFVILSFFLTARDAADIVKIGAFILLSGSPVDISMWIKNFKTPGGKV